MNSEWYRALDFGQPAVRASSKDAEGDRVTATISERLLEWLTQMWNGETALVTDDAWLPNPTGEQASGAAAPAPR